MKIPVPPRAGIFFLVLSSSFAAICIYISLNVFTTLNVFGIDFDLK